MNRRRLLTMLIGSLAAASAPVWRAVHGYGYLTPAICRTRGLDPTRALVRLDGVVVSGLSEKIMACDDRLGYIEVLTRDAGGRLHIDPRTGRLARARRYGRVAVTFEGPLRG